MLCKNNFVQCWGSVLCKTHQERPTTLMVFFQILWFYSLNHCDFRPAEEEQILLCTRPLLSAPGLLQTEVEGMKRHRVFAAQKAAPQDRRALTFVAPSLVSSLGCFCLPCLWKLMDLGAESHAWRFCIRLCDQSTLFPFMLETWHLWPLIELLFWLLLWWDGYEKRNKKLTDSGLI